MNIGDLIIGINGTLTSDYLIASGYGITDNNEPVQITDYDDNKTYFDGGFIYNEELENFKVI